MTVYKFLDEEERLTKKYFRSWEEAKAFAKEHELRCMTMEQKAFLTAFEEKVGRLKGHDNASRLTAMAEKAIAARNGLFQYQVIAADDFMERVIEMPTAYLEDWLEGKNDLEWLPDYLSEEECMAKVTYTKERGQRLSLPKQIANAAAAAPLPRLTENDKTGKDTLGVERI